MHTDPASPPRGGLANLATAVAVVLCVILAVAWTQSGSEPVLQAPAPLADSGAGASGGVVDAPVAGSGDTAGEEDPGPGGALWSDGAGEGAAEERRSRRGRRAERRGGRRETRGKGRERRRARRGGARRRRRGGMRPQRRGGGSTAGVTGALSRPPAEAPPAALAPAPEPCCADGAAEAPPEFALG